MDRFSGYYQIMMYPEDEKHASFRMSLGCIATPWCPFGLKNARDISMGMNTIFHEHTRKTIECYVDDIIVKGLPKVNTLQILGEYSISCGSIN